MPAFDYALTFGGVPFLSDRARSFRLTPEPSEHDPTPERSVLRKQQPEADLLEEIDRLLPSRDRTQYITLPESSRLMGLARQPDPLSSPRVGEWCYPTGVARWSVFRGVMPSACVQALPAGFAAFVMKAVPFGSVAADYTLTTSLRVLDTRPLAEHHGTRFDGLHLVTLVDERYDWQDRPCTLTPGARSTWAGLIADVGTALGVTVTHSAISADYGQPEPDSSLWATAESAAALLDALAANVGRVAVREMGGGITLLTPGESALRVAANRTRALGNLGRLAGGPVSGAVPAEIKVAFPRYVYGDDPVPHFLNPRYQDRPTSWDEEGYGAAYAVTVPGSGVGVHTVRSAAKAFQSGEATSPFNASGLGALANRIGADYLTARAVSYDECYAGTSAWVPEGIHDLVWTYAETRRQASTRVTPSPWNDGPRTGQQAAPLSGRSIIPPGVGGRAVAQTWRDGFSGAPSTVLPGGLASGSLSATLSDASYLPTGARWKGKVAGEIILFEGTSGSTSVGVARRGIDGTMEAAHPPDTRVEMVAPQTVYGANLVTVGPGQFVEPQVWTSGGVAGARLIPQTQTVQCLTSTKVSGTLTSGNIYCSGRVGIFDPTYSGGFVPHEYVWVRERNNNALTSGRLYDGQFGWYSPSFAPGLPTAPVYLVNDPLAVLPTGGTSPSTGPVSCPPMTFNESDALCESGALNVYTRLVSVAMVSGCLTFSRGAWTFDHPAGCCDCTSGAYSSGGAATSGGGGGGGGNPVTTGCCAPALPAILNVTLLAISSDCGCAQRVSTLTYNPASGKWEGAMTFGDCGPNITLKFYCTGATAADFFMDYEFSNNCVAAASMPPAFGPDIVNSCVPLSISFDLAIGGPNCGCTGLANVIRIVVTE